jgi:hypothetical protein
VRDRQTRKGGTNEPVDGRRREGGSGREAGSIIRSHLCYCSLDPRLCPRFFGKSDSVGR